MQIIVDKICFVCRISHEEFKGVIDEKQQHAQTKRNIDQSHMIMALLLTNLGLKAGIVKSLLLEAKVPTRYKTLIANGLKQYERSKVFRGRYCTCYMHIMELRNTKK